MEGIQLVQEQILHAIKGTPDLDPVQELVRLQETGMDRLPLAVKVNVYVVKNHWWHTIDANDSYFIIHEYDFEIQ